MMTDMHLEDVVGIRGLNLAIDDIEDQDIMAAGDGEEEPVSTLMWNPLHYAVYYQNTEILRYLIKDMKINLALTAPKAPAENEKENVNNDKYDEDKIMVLLLAYDRRNPQMLKYLLDEGFRYWPPKKTLKKLINERLLDEVTRHCEEMSSMNGGRN